MEDMQVRTPNCASGIIYSFIDCDTSVDLHRRPRKGARPQRPKPNEPIKSTMTQTWEVFTREPDERYTTLLGFYSRANLQTIVQQLVHPCHLGRNTQVDSTVPNLNDKPATNIGVNLNRTH